MSNIKKYYIQDSRSFMGNAIVWWGKDSKGYTSDIMQAGIYSEEEALKIVKDRNTDIAWPVDYINNNQAAKKIIIDSQYLDRKQRLL